MPSTERLPIYRRVVGHVVRRPLELDTLSRWMADRQLAPLERRSPWWPYTLPPWLLATLPKGANVYEFGAGGSTLWLEDHGFAVTSVESDPDWYATLRDVVRASTRLRLVEPAQHGVVASEVAPGFYDDYVADIGRFPDEEFDLVIVDGRCRVAATMMSMAKVRPGGLLLLDDSQRSRYHSLFSTLADWPVQTFLALRPGGSPPAPTTVWRKPQRLRRRPRD